MQSLDSQTSEPVFVLTPQTLGTAFTSQTALGHRRSLPAFPTIGLLVPLGKVFFLSFLLLMVPVMWKGFLLTWTQSSQGWVQNHRCQARERKTNILDGELLVHMPKGSIVRQGSRPFPVGKRSPGLPWPIQIFRALWDCLGFSLDSSWRPYSLL